VDDPITRMELAQTYIMTGQTTSAIGELVAALEKPQCSINARLLLEKIYKDTGRNEDLQKFYDQAVAKYPDDPYWLHRAGAYVLTQYQIQYEQEQTQARKQGKLKPNEVLMPSAVSEKTLALLNKAKPLLEKAWTLSDATWKQAPGYYAKYLDFYLETLLQEQETQTQLTQNVRIASKYVSTPLETIAYSQMAQMNKKMGDRTKTLELFDKALESAKAQPEYVVQLLDVMRKVLESDKEVRAWCDRTLAADPKHLGATYTMFQLSQSAGQFNTAIEYIDRCLAQLQTKNDTWVEYTIQKSQVLLQAFFKTSDKKYLDGGVVLYESILAALENNTSHPKRAMILNNLAFLLADNNQQLDKAVEYARRALKDAPSDPVRMDTLAYTLSKSNQFEEAEKMARMSIQYHELAGNSVPWDGYYHLGMAQEGLKKKAEAKAAYQKALDTGGDAIPAPDKEQLATAVKRVSQ
jgi:tetratricopeptide (TPR) repeat protein